MTLFEIRKNTVERLQLAGIEACDYETWVLMEWKLGVRRADYYMDSQREIDEDSYKEFEAVLSQREKHVPLQYLMHHCEFMGYEFYVDENVLIPRQDTECLVEEAWNFLKNRVALAKILGKKPLRVLDLCTGSGCIGISLKLLCPDLEVVLADLSDGALVVAKKNASQLQAEVTILQGDLFEALNGLTEEEKSFDLIISNPPYIPTEVVEGLMPEVRDHEPHMALDGLEDGLAFYRKITEESVHFLKKNGGLYYEIGCEQGEDVSGFLKKHGFVQVSVTKDLAGLDRIVSGILS